MTTLSPFLRNVLVADAVTGLGAGIALIAGADVMQALLGLPSQLLFWSGIALIPFVAGLVAILRASTTTGISWIIGANLVWVAASIYVAFGPSFTPTPLGQVFVCIQAAAVFILAELQLMGLRRGRVTA